MGERLDTAVRVTASAARAEEYGVVLEAVGIAGRVAETGAGWAVLVAPGDARRAGRTLTAYDAENRPRPVAETPPVEYGRTWVGAVVAVLLMAFFAATGPWKGGSIWFDRGSAAAAQILKGEAWRTVTALTLHADPMHVLGNAAACALFVTAVGRWLGPGIGVWLVLLAGVGGNALTALVVGTNHVSVGASTATFGAVGALAARQFIARRRRPWARRTAWVVIGASLALLGLLGTGAGADIPAHLLGLLLGGALGTGAALAIRRPLRPAAQWALALAAAGFVAGSWWLALAAATRG